MSCTTFREPLLDRADGRPVADPAALDAHLAACPACTALAAKLGAPPALPAVALPPALMSELREDLQRQLEEIESPHLLTWMFRGSFSVPKPLAWAAAVLAFVLWSARPPAPPPPAKPAPAVLMNGVDRLSLGGEAAQG